MYKRQVQRHVVDDVHGLLQAILVGVRILQLGEMLGAGLHRVMTHGVERRQQFGVVFAQYVTQDLKTQIHVVLQAFGKIMLLRALSAGPDVYKRQWLIASSMRKRSGSTVLSAAMRETFKQSETHRIVRFYDERFASSADNVVSAYSTMADGLDALGLTNIGMSESILKRLPVQTSFLIRRKLK